MKKTMIILATLTICFAIKTASHADIWKRLNEQKGKTITIALETGRGEKLITGTLAETFSLGSYLLISGGKKYYFNTGRLIYFIVKDKANKK